jgi:hypothetical protein
MVGLKWPGSHVEVARSKWKTKVVDSLCRKARDARTAAIAAPDTAYAVATPRRKAMRLDMPRLPKLSVSSHVLMGRVVPENGAMAQLSERQCMVVGRTVSVQSKRCPIANDLGLIALTVLTAGTLVSDLSRRAWMEFGVPPRR